VSIGGYLGGIMVFNMGVMINRNAYRTGPADFTPAAAKRELAEGQLKRVLVEEQPVVLLSLDGRIHALGAVCSHYGAPLNDGTIVCSFSGRRDSGGAFTASSGVFLCTNPAAATPVWLDRSDANMEYWTKDFVINPYAPGQSNWFACVFNGWGGPPNDKGGIYRNANRGITWQRLADNSLAPSAS
jgi:nitrite reductase/ring-hydroxylating ferredoxin subunit